MARRLTSRDEHRLLRLKELLDANLRYRHVLIEQRDDLILELIQSGCRIVDIADVLGLSRRAVEQARDRSKARGDA